MASSVTREPTLIALSAKIAEWFPDLGGRAFAVSEVNPFDKQNDVPSLPVAVVGLLTEQGAQGKFGGSRITLNAQVMLQFIFEPLKYKRQDGAATPFYAFYDYEAIRNRLLSNLVKWRTPLGGAITYQAMDVESDEFAVYISFRLLINEEWCAIDLESDEQPFQFTIHSTLSAPCPDPCCDDPCPEPKTPC